MPDPALPTPLPVEPGQTKVRLHREYRDALGRPMTGRVILTPVQQTESGTAYILPVPVRIELIGGEAEAYVAPGPYQLSGVLRTADRASVVISTLIELPEEDSSGA